MSVTKDNITTGQVPSEPELPVWKLGQKKLFTEDFKRRAVGYYESLPEDGSRGGLKMDHVVGCTQG